MHSLLEFYNFYCPGTPTEPRGYLKYRELLCRFLDFGSQSVKLWRVKPWIWLSSMPKILKCSFQEYDNVYWFCATTGSNIPFFTWDLSSLVRFTMSASLGSMSACVLTASSDLVSSVLIWARSFWETRNFCSIESEIRSTYLSDKNDEEWHCRFQIEQIEQQQQQ